MTYDDAIRLQDKWKTQAGKTICKHNQLFYPLMSKNGEKTNARVCLVCGEAYESPP